MASNERTVAYGTLEDNGDTWFLVKPDRFIFLDVSFVVENSLEHKSVSVIGKMGVPPSSPGIVKLIVDKLVSRSAPNANCWVSSPHLPAAVQ